MTGRKRKAAGWILGMMVAVTAAGTTAAADDAYTGSFPAGLTLEGSQLTLADSAFSVDYGVMPYGDYLAEGGCSITRTENFIATVDGYTASYRTCDELYLGLYMDRLEDDGTWQTVYEKEVSGEDCFHLAYSDRIFVTPGYYYRMRAGHIARFGEIMESNVSSTDGIFFGEGHDE